MQQNESFHRPSRTHVKTEVITIDEDDIGGECDDGSMVKFRNNVGEVELIRYFEPQKTSSRAASDVERKSELIC